MTKRFSWVGLLPATLATMVAVGCGAPIRDGAMTGAGGSTRTGAGGTTGGGSTGTGGTQGTTDGWTGTFPPEAWVGDWGYAQGTAIETCDGFDPASYAVGGQLSIAQGANGTLLVSEDGGCTLTFDVSGATASAVAGQTCEVTDGAGGSQLFSIDDWTLTLTADGTLYEALTAGEETTDPNGNPLFCDYTEQDVALVRP